MRKKPQERNRRYTEPNTHSGSETRVTESRTDRLSSRMEGTDERASELGDRRWELLGLNSREKAD